MKTSPDKILAAAGMKARGRSSTEIAEVMGVSRRTVISWSHTDVWKTEHARVERELNSGPTVHGTLLDALSAMKGDGIDWTSRLKAATELRNKPLPEVAAEVNEGITIVQFTISAERAAEMQAESEREMAEAIAARWPDHAEAPAE